MAIPFEVQIGRISRYLSKWASTKGSSPRVTMGSEVMPVLPMWSGVENRFLDSWNRFGYFLSVAAVASNTSGIRLRNPVGSNVIIIFEKFTYFAGAVEQITFQNGPNTADLGTTQSLATTRFDNRGQPQPTLIVSQQSSAATLPVFTPGPTNTFYSTLVNANVPGEVIVTDQQEIPLLQGDSIQISPGAVNQAIALSFFWRERGLEESERQ